MIWEYYENQISNPKFVEKIDYLQHNINERNVKSNR